MVSSLPKRTPEEVRKLPSITAYRAMLKASGVDPSSRLPSPEALLRRIAQGKSLYSVNSAVDAYNLAILESGVGLGGYDLDTLMLPVDLRLAQKNETIDVLGDEVGSSRKIDAGEIVYADRHGPICLDLNYRDAKRSAITANTKNILLIADGAPGLSKEQLFNALRNAGALIQQFCGGKAESPVA
jgi:DNA/RNA-binding domain of Phe-tRNA-synthetase-like protein